MSSRPLVSVVVPFFNAERFIEEALRSVFDQSYDAWELLLVDDGSTDGSTGIALHYAEQYTGRVRYLEHKGHENRGQSASRNLGIRHARGEYVAFLDSDDVWLPNILERQVAILESQPEAAMVYGSAQWWYGWTGKPEDAKRDYVEVHRVPLNTLINPPTLLIFLLRRIGVPCPCTVMMRREAIGSVDGFEDQYRHTYEDQVFYSKVFLSMPVFVADECWAKYRLHPDSVCAIAEKAGESRSDQLVFFNWLGDYLSKERVESSEVWDALRTAVQSASLGDLAAPVYEGWHDCADCHTISGWAWDMNHPDSSVKVDIWADSALVTTVTADEFRQDLSDAGRGNGCHAFSHHVPSHLKDRKPHSIRVTVSGTNFDLSSTPRSINCKPHAIPLQAYPRRVAARKSVPAIFNRLLAKSNEGEYHAGRVRFGSLRRVTPISNVWGFDRGHPIDRYYIENFLASHAHDIHDRVLEIGFDAYTRAFGDNRVVKSDVLNLSKGDPKTTIVADLANAPHIRSDTYDCIILTQTLQYIYDLRLAIQTLYRVLKPGGTLLATFPGITQTNDPESGDHWYWNLTPISARRLFEEIFPPEKMKIEAHGNVLAAIAFLHGLSTEELHQKELDYRQQGYDVIITVRAVK